MRNGETIWIKAEININEHTERTVNELIFFSTDAANQFYRSLMQYPNYVITDYIWSYSGGRRCNNCEIVSWYANVMHVNVWWQSWFFFLLFTILKSIILILHYFLLTRVQKLKREILQSFGLLSNFVARNRKLIIYSFFSARRRHTCLQLQWDVTSVVEFTLLHICHCMQKQICNHFFESDYISEIWCRIFWHPLKSIFSRGCQRCIFVQQRALKYLNLN